MDTDEDEFTTIVNPSYFEKITDSDAPTCSICCDNGDYALNIRERCLSCRVLMCGTCVSKYLHSANNPLVVSCPSCGKRWDDWESLGKLCLSNVYGWDERVRRALFDEIKPELDARVRDIRREKLKEIIRDLADHVKKSWDQLELARHIGTTRVRDTIQRDSSLNEDASHLVRLVEFSFDETVEALKDLASFVDAKSKTLRQEATNDKKFRCASSTCTNGVVFASTDGRCASCRAKHCVVCESRVLTAIEEGKSTEHHMCDETTLSNVRALSDTSVVRQCPRCTIRVIKDGGCDDMYCTKCSIFFKWSTGKIIEKTHNPDHLEHVRRINATMCLAREFGDVECGGLIHETMAQRLFTQSIDEITKLKATDAAVNFKEALILYRTYNVLDVFNLMNTFYNACVRWKTTKNNVRSTERSNVIATYVDHVITNETRIRIPRFIRPFIDNSLKWKVRPLEYAGRPEVTIGRVLNRNNCAIKRCIPTHCWTFTTLDLDEYVRWGLFDAKMLDECEEKYYETVMTFVKCCNDVFGAFTKRALELQNLNETIAIHEYLIKLYRKNDDKRHHQQRDSHFAVDYSRHVVDKLSPIHFSDYGQTSVERRAYIFACLDEAFKNFDIDAALAIDRRSSDYDRAMLKSLHLTKCRLRAHTWTKFEILVDIFNDRVRELANAYDVELWGIQLCNNKYRLTDSLIERVKAEKSKLIVYKFCHRERLIPSRDYEPQYELYRKYLQDKSNEWRYDDLTKITQIW